MEKSKRYSPDGAGSSGNGNNENIIIPASIEIPLPIEKNRANDCGVLCVQMVLLKDTKIDKNELSIEGLSKRVNKTFEEGTNPGSICKILKEEGYDVHFFSTIDWQSITNDPKISINKWDKRVQFVLGESKKTATKINEEKLQDSAKWLTLEENKEIISKKNLSILDIADLVREGNRVIALVKTGGHYVLITGVDTEKVYFNDPAANEVPSKKSLTHNEFLKYGSPAENLRDAVVANIS